MYNIERGLRGMEEGDILTVRETAKLLKISEATIYRMVEKKEIPYIRVGEKIIRFRRSDIDRWLSDSTQTIKRNENST